MKMRKIVKYSVLSVLIVLSAISVYYIYVIYEAQQYTKRVIRKDLANAQWRKPDGQAIRFALHRDDLSERHIEILLKVQDPGFHGHRGIDLSTPGAGLTTITQAIVKKLYFKDFKPGIAKIKQSLIAKFVVNELISKDEQLTVFANTMHFGMFRGEEIIGFESAANSYFRQSLADLTEDQYIRLVAMLVAPSTFHVIDHPEWNKERSNRIKDLVSGEYQPEGLMDQFYGELPQEVIDSGLPPSSYFRDPQKKTTTPAR